ncbi:MAG: SWIM zinc finger family protein [Methanomicrobiales archaeon]|nr:SWIM zinc finger family protein [Methanomicrobiales archaeon]
MTSYYPWYPKTSPIPVKDGIRVRSRRGAIGEQWWSKQWVALLSTFGWSSRLDRGKRYARKGQVMEFRITPGEVTARVQGSMKTPYRVTIQISPFSSEKWGHILDILAGKALYAAKLLAGEIPHTIGDAFSEAGIELFPKTRQEIRASCSCPDYAVPCKHIAAVHFVLAEAFDQDPFMIFTLRGLPRNDLMAGLSARRAADSEVETEEKTPAGPSGGPEEKTMTITIIGFWGGGEKTPLVYDLSPPLIPAGIIRRLGKPAFWDNPRDFYEVMTTLYEDVAMQARRTFLGDEEESTPPRPSYTPVSSVPSKPLKRDSVSKKRSSRGRPGRDPRRS